MFELYQKMINKKLNNGANIYFDIDTTHKYSTVMMFFAIGWRHDFKNKMGMAHLFEHLVGKRTLKHALKGELHTKKNKLGISFNAVTLPGSTSYYHNQTHENISASLDLLMESVYESVFDSEDLEIEKKIVLRESANYDENKNNYIWKSVVGNVYKDSTLSNSIFGNEVTLSNIKVEDFIEFYNYYLNPNNASFVITIKEEEQIQKILNQIEDYYSKSAALTKSGAANMKENFVYSDQEIVITNDNKNQADIAVVYNHVKLSSEQMLIWSVLFYLLVGPWSSVLFNKLRDELGLTYHIGMNFYNYSDIAFTYFNLSVDRDNDKKTINVITDTLKDFIRSIDSDMLESAKNKSMFNIVANSSPQKEAEYIRNTLISGNDPLSSKQKLEIIGNITSEDVVNLSEIIFNKSQPSVIVIK